MLKNIDPVMTADLLWALAAMGHGDTLAVVDVNYPAHALHSRVITLAGVDLQSSMTAIGSLFPIDRSEDPAVFAMVPDGGSPIASHASVAEILTLNEGREIRLGSLPRFEFYAEAKKAFAVVLTGEMSPYACFLLTKGVL